jgi:hypothetical protein
MSMITFKEWRDQQYETNAAEFAHGGMTSPADPDYPEGRRAFFDRNKKRPPTFGMSVKSPEELTVQEPEQTAPGQLPGYSSDTGTHMPNVGDPKGKAYVPTLLKIHRLERQLAQLKRDIGL